MEKYSTDNPFILNSAIITFTVVISFLLYHFISSSKKFKKSIKAHYGKKTYKVYIVLFRRLLGFFFYGILPVSVISLLGENLTRYGLSYSNAVQSLKWVVILSPVIVLINYLNSGKADNLKMYPQIRKKKWTRSLVFVSALSWIVYLCAYEFMFRGILLFSSFYAFGATTAIVINICIYSLVHLPKGIKETFGAIPLGIIFCILTLKTNSILVALFVHIVMALSNEWFSIKAHKKIKIVKK